MKITTLPPENSRPGRSSDAAKGGDSAGTGATRATQNSTDRVNLSNIATQLAAAVATEVEPARPADPARLADLRDAVQSGRLSVDVRGLAEAILAEDASIGGGGKQ